MRRFAMLLSVLLFVSSAGAQQAPPGDVSGWMQAKWGMTEADVKRAFGSKISQVPPDTEDLPTSTFVGLLKLRDIDVAGIVFEAVFMFDKKSRRLEYVVLRPTDITFKSESTFDELEKLLTDKYGRPRYRDDKRQPGRIELTRRWSFPTSAIELRYWYAEIINSRLVSLIYSRTSTPPL